MADSDTAADAHKHKISQELLSPSELFQARSRSHKIPVKGQKDFLPDASEHQRSRLQQSLDEHWTLLQEERVERLGNLVKAVWVPEERRVELQSPAGKFWHSMGFSDRGKQCLHAEEALYLMECGNVQVFYRDLPLSIQEGYERFLSPETLTLHQYQVYGHLKRLGYVVNRFDLSSVPSEYERQLNLSASIDSRQRKPVKRKRSQSPVSSDNRSTSPLKKTTAEHQSETQMKSNESPAGQTTPDQPQEELMESLQVPEDSSERTWWTEEHIQLPSAQSQTRAPRWDFKNLSFPDLGSRSRSACLESPDPSLLPGALEVGDCHVTPWLRRLNVKEEKLSRRERDRQRDRDRYHRDINRDPKVRDCRNWAEYIKLMEERRRQQQKQRPAHLWEREVTPLTQPGQCTSHREVQERISIIKSPSWSEGVSRTPPADHWKISFDVFQPDTVAEFKKSHPGKPYSRMCVCSFNGPVPDLRIMKQLSCQSGDVPVTFAAVDHGDISFYCFKNFRLPSDVY